MFVSEKIVCRVKLEWIEREDEKDGGQKLHICV
jgi:hypothetical protein